MKCIANYTEGEDGFTLMELMIVIVIIGILAGLAVPLYNGMQQRAKRVVGEDNVQMLNDAIEQLIALERMAKQRSLGEDPFNGADINHHNVLMEYIGYSGREMELKYVEWKTDPSIALKNSLGRYVLQRDFVENGLSIPK